MTNDDDEQRLTASDPCWEKGPGLITICRLKACVPDPHSRCKINRFMVDILLILGMCIVERSPTASSKSYRKVRDAEGSAQRFYVGCLSGFTVSFRPK